MYKIIVYTVTLLISLRILYNFSNWWVGGYIEGMKIALLGSAGNTVPAEIAAIAALLGLVRSFIGIRAGSAAWAMGRLAGILTFTASSIAIFANGVLAYMKFQPSEVGTNAYVVMLGSPVLEVTMIVTLVIGFFIKTEPKPIRKK